jgi:hypothetical protein
MPRAAACPFFTSYDGTRIYCDAGRLNMPSRAAWDEYMKNYCCSVEGWEKCSVALELRAEYERRSDNGKEKH